MKRIHLVLRGQGIYPALLRRKVALTRNSHRAERFGRVLAVGIGHSVTKILDTRRDHAFLDQLVPG
jgi:hypothetical protein